MLSLLGNRIKRFRNKDQAILTASDGAVAAWFGNAVSLSSDGSTALVGSTLNTIGANTNQGSAYVFIRSGNTWTQQTKLTDAIDGADSDYFGHSVALSNDGNTALIGIPNDDISFRTNQGSALVFTRSGSTWTQQADLSEGSGLTDDNFGWSVALSGDGNTALIGVPGEDIAFNGQGGAIIFTRSGSTWSIGSTLYDSAGGAADALGYSVALSNDGNTAIVGAYRDDVGANTNQGSACIFTRSGGTWTQQAKLVDSTGANNDEFGTSVALSSDGNTALIGAPNSTSSKGSAVVFTRSGTTWTQQIKLTDSSGANNDRFGYSVALSNDGNTALIASNGDTPDPTASVFTRSNNTWTQQPKITNTVDPGDELRSVDLSNDGKIALLGFIRGNSNKGSATVFYRR
jgi:hypothetical protein